MSTVEDRLAELGLKVPTVATPVGSYCPAKREGAFIYTSGQLPVVAGQLETCGKVGQAPGLVSPQRANELAALCALNAIAAIKSVVGDLDRIDSIVKVVGFVASDPSFTAQAGVLNGASDLLATAFGDKGVHARSAVGVAVLPLDAPVEIEIIVTVRQ